MVQPAAAKKPKANQGEPAEPTIGCEYRFVKGKNKGGCCNKKVVDGQQYCTKHIGYAVAPADGCVYTLKSGKVCGKKAKNGLCSKHQPVYLPEPESTLPEPESTLPEPESTLPEPELTLESKHEPVTQASTPKSEFPVPRAPTPSSAPRTPASIPLASPKPTKKRNDKTLVLEETSEAFSHLWDTIDIKFDFDVVLEEPFEPYVIDEDVALWIEENGDVYMQNPQNNTKFIPYMIFKAAEAAMEFLREDRRIDEVVYDGKYIQVKTTPLTQ
jgi:hypothetical protein